MTKLEEIIQERPAETMLARLVYSAKLLYFHNFITETEYRKIVQRLNKGAVK